MTYLPRSLQPERTANPIRRGRFNTALAEEGGAVTSGGGDPAPGGNSEPPTVTLANLYQTVKDYTDAHLAEFANACPYGPGNWDWLDGVVAALQAVDERVGFCWRPERNNVGGDVVCYYHGALPPVDGSTDVYVVDVIHSSCGPDAAPAWNDATSPAAIREWRSVRT